MILVTGGRGQGKREFSQSAIIDSFQEDSVIWCDGGIAGWETFIQAKYGWNFHLFIRRVMQRDMEMLPDCISSTLPEASPGSETTWTREALDKLASFMVQSLVENNPQRILVTDDIGYGIVPADYFERVYREETGRVCCQAAARSQQVWRVCCGLGQRIK